MYQNYPNFYQPAQTTSRPIPQQQLPIQQPSFLKGRLVASVDEVRATPIDFDGSVFFFPDLANKKIYTKQINLDGTSSLNMYELKDIPLQSPIDSNSSNYVTRQEFDSTMEQIKSILSKTQTKLESQQAIQQNAPSNNEQPKFEF